MPGFSGGRSTRFVADAGRQRAHIANWTATLASDTATDTTAANGCASRRRPGLRSA
ncbi:hypothetical protein BGLA2_1080029 [Burkholderia gladioli]|nr:hypothetical protein BGLA2_1080029 [Burkholderia gladioli]